MKRKIREIADRYEYTGIVRFVFTHIIGPTAYIIGYAMGYVKGVTRSVKG